MTQAIFLSYASQDADAARRICEALRAAGLEVWFDQSELRGGDAWDASIRKQIKECALFVPMISSNTQAREEGYFRREWNLAVNRMLDMADDKAFLLPVLIDATAEPAARVPERFRERQWTRVLDDAAMASFVQRIVKLLSGSGFPTINAPKASPVLEFASTPQTKLEASPSIAVLAFANRSASADDEYFSDGLADELLNVFARIQGLRVAARTSAFSFKGKQTTVADIGRILNVAAVLEGSVRKSGNRVRISVQLVKVADGYNLWSETYDRTLDDVFAVQDDIAQSVVTQLRGLLMGESPSATQATERIAQEIALAASGRSELAEVQRLCLQGRYFVNKRTPADSDRACGLFEQAVALDPESARVHVGLAMAYMQSAFYGYASARAPADTLRYLRQVEQSALTALRLDPTLAEPHMSLSWIAWIANRDSARAMREMEAAQRLAPGDPEVLRNLAHRHMDLGNFAEADALYVRGIALDPLSIVMRINYSMSAMYSGRIAEARLRAEKALEIDASSWIIHFQLCSVARVESDHAAAVESRARAAELRGDPNAAAFHRASFANGGWRAYLRALTESPQYCFSWYEVSLAFAQLGEMNHAFEKLDQSIAAYEQHINWIRNEPMLVSLRADPRFTALLKRAGFPT